jgi:leader peptidase (prepilin peptidase)/N-methyltransferase
MSALTPIAFGVLLLILIPIVHSDLRARRIPNLLNALLAVAGLVLSAFTASGLRAFLLGLIAPVAILVVFLGLIALMKLLRRPGTLGLGDVKFLAAASLWVGFLGSTMVFIVASLLSVVFVLARAPWRPVNLRGAIPFAPFLAAGLLVVYGLSALPGRKDAANAYGNVAVNAPADVSAAR